MMFGTNPLAPLLTALIQEEEAVDFGRFRDAYLVNEDGEAMIAIYTRNGGGNREHFARDVHWQQGPNCVWDESAGESGAWAINPDCDEEHEPVPAEGPDCPCTGCTITYRLPKHSLYVRDYDDDFDPTYATVLFRLPESLDPEIKKALALATTPESQRPEGVWQDLIAGLEKERPEDIEGEGRGHAAARALLRFFQERKEQPDQPDENKENTTDGDQS